PYMQQNILTPLGMNSSSYIPDNAMLQNIAKGYSITSNGLDATLSQRDLQNGKGFLLPGGGLLTNVGDLAKYLSLELGRGPNGIIQQSTMSNAYANAISTKGSPSSGDSYGIGFEEYHQGSITIVGHSGATHGYSSMAYVNLAAKVGIIVFRNI